ncbi:SDR family oxidoreductase [Streptomyces endophyticus]|uniref:NAD(P)H-binding protein n=1 Tax=Streptomyces endophyticus TaxID=714166 RepID=A0ABU6F651_9ACTN|nr:NAD(P)H-binding protein [Streptomyces endophyticus]MEB8339501.1 NAD(P)H-binding protein [Streptomyces endophyticus]
MPTATTFAVAGATGRLGRHIMDVLTERGHRAVPMSRATGVDIITGTGLEQALTGADTILDAASWHASDKEAAAEFFRTAADNLHRAGQRAGVERIIAMSIIGADKATAGFIAAQQAHEEAHLAGTLPACILRAAQFHELVGQLLDWQQGDTAYVPALPAQLVACRTVAEALVDLATDPDVSARQTPGTPIPEIAGPRRETLSEAAALLAARRDVKVVATDGSTMPDADLAASGAFLPGPHAKLAGPTFQEWLAAQPRS